ncbi:MAG: hypothetical protein MJ232_03545 [archaeon]|nr:hypothetical protein [archaeon]
MKLNTNIASLKVLNTMNKNNSRLEKSIERLSSGLKINKAADDATGLAISRKMQVQIDALGKASENANDGISLIQTAEGALNEVHSILQRMRELSIQSANGSLSDEDRNSVQSEIDMLKDEVDRISSTVQFNSMNLLDGSIDSKTYSDREDVATVISTSDGVDTGKYNFTVDKAATQTSIISNTINRGIVGEDGKMKTSGTIYINGAQIDITTNMTEEEAYAALRDAAELSDVTLKSTTGKLVSLDASGNNTAKLVLEHQIHGEREITFGGDETLLMLLGFSNATKDTASTTRIEVTGTALDQDLTACRGQSVKVNGIDVEFTDDMTTMKDLLMKMQKSDICGTAVQESADGTSILFDSAFFELGLETTDNTDLYSAISDLWTTSTKTTYADGTDLLNGTVGRNAVVTIPPSVPNEGFTSGTTYKADGNKITFTGVDGFELLVENAGQVGDVELIITAQGRLDLQIGANNGQTMTIRIPNMSSKAIGIENINIRTRLTAEDAISALDDAIAKVSQVRSKLGAFQNRLDYTVNSLTSSQQNLTESLSRIQDTDMAEEMSEYTQSNILSEAGISILAQANQRPQGILTLLQNMI